MKQNYRGGVSDDSFCCQTSSHECSKVFFPHLVFVVQIITTGFESFFFLLTCVCRVSSRPSHQSDTVGRGLRTFNCIVKSTPTFLFFEREKRKNLHCEQVEGKVNLVKISAFFSTSPTLGILIMQSYLIDVGDPAGVKVRASALLIFFSSSYILIFGAVNGNMGI